MASLPKAEREVREEKEKHIQTNSGGKWILWTSLPKIRVKLKKAGGLSGSPEKLSQEGGVGWLRNTARLLEGEAGTVS